MPAKKNTPKNVTRGAAPTVGIDIPRYGAKPHTKPIIVGRPHWEHAPDSIPLPGHTAPAAREAAKAAPAAARAQKTGAKGRRVVTAPAVVPAPSVPTPTK